MMHDLLEDTKFNSSYYFDSYDENEWYIYECLELLHKKENVEYAIYLKNIKDNYENHPEAYWVKLADMKDHLNQKETLKEKYLNSIDELM